MIDALSFGTKGILPSHTSEVGSRDPVGSDVVKITQQFAQLLIAQISNQDPDNPVENTEIISQYAQMLATLGNVKMQNTVEQQVQVNLGNDLVGQKIAYLHPEQPQISVTGPDGQTTLADNIQYGYVQEVNYDGDKPVLTIEGKTNATIPFEFQHGDVPVANVRRVLPDLEIGTEIIGKTITYVDPLEPFQLNPAYVSSSDTPNETKYIEDANGNPSPNTKTGIVTEINFGTGRPLMKVTGAAADVSPGFLARVHN